METITGDNEVHPSVEKVLSNEDLLMEILVTLPVISLDLFRFVSKWWLSVITSPKFLTRRSRIPNLDPTSGFFLCERSHNRRSRHRSRDYHFLPLDSRIPANSYRLPSNLEGASLTIWDSCNGLFVCSSGYGTVSVYNSSIHLFKTLPTDLPDCAIMDVSPWDEMDGGLKIAFNPTKSPYFKVVNAQFYNSNADCIEIQIYSSKTGKWNVDAKCYYASDFQSFPKGVYWNDSIHWLQCQNGQIVHYTLDLVENPPKPKPEFDTLNVTWEEYYNLIEPKSNLHHDLTLDAMVDHFSYFRLFESRGCLLSVFASDTPDIRLNVYEMTNEDSGWSLKHFVTFDENNWKSPPNEDIWNSFEVLSVSLGKREEDSYLVMFLDGKVLRYDFMSRNVSTLAYFQSSHRPESYEFIASFAHM